MRIGIEDTCEPYMYNTYSDLNKIEIGDVITLKFSNKKYKVNKNYVGKTIKFVVNNYLKYRWHKVTRRLALVPFNKKDDFKTSDVLFLDDAERFECLMIDLFPCNRKPYAGWKNKTVKIIHPF